MWKHKKFRPSREWKSFYGRLNGERVFILRLQGTLPKNVENVERVYDSWQAAKAAGWVKVK